MEQAHAPAYRLVRRPVPAAPAARLDEAQQAVVDHAGGPLLVLAGPGTGKTTTIVAAVADRIERRGLDPERVLVLTFSRKAAAELRERITARLRRTTREPLAMTFHSYAYALARREFVLAGDESPRLLSAPEQLLEVRRMLRGEAQDGGARWPEALRSALATRGFAEEVRDLLLRAAERGLDGRGLSRLGQLLGRDDWVAAAAFLDRYAARFDLAPVPAYDYAEIVRIAAALLTREEIRQRERAAYDVVFVDEYQDSDPAQESLLLALAGDGRELIAVGDPDQSIYEFRGADVRALTEFPERFHTAAGQPAPVIPLQTCRRSGTVLLAASRRVARRLPRGPVGHRDLIAGNPAPGEIRILIADSSTQEAALVADTLRRAHLADGVPWSSMAVLVRSAARQVPLLRRALTAAGVPVTVAGDELPPADEPGTRPLLMLLRCALRPALLDDQTAAELLCGPLGGTDALGLRRLRRALGLLAEAGGDRVRGGADLLAEALLSPRDLTALPDSVAGPARRVARLLAVAKAAIRAGGNAEDVLWAIWDASGLAPQWQQASAAGGAVGAAADRDLDAVLALFDKAAHFADTMPPGSPGLFADSLAGQEIVGDTLAERAVRDDCVRVLTAHRAKGLEWDVVVVAGVQEETWPDLRLRGSVLGAGELAEVVRSGLSETGRPGEARGGAPARDVDAAMLAAKLLAEERRLFYVAVTRARRLLVVTAAGGEDTDLRPSRFLTELAGDDVPIERIGGGGHGVYRWLSMPALVADLRRVAADTGRPLEVRQAAAAQLARLAGAGVRAAHPRDWYALTELSDASAIVAAGETVRLSPSQVESFTRCGLRWLLEAAVGAGRSDVLRHLGTVIHAAAVLAASGATEQQVADRIDEIWHHLDFGSAWYSAKQRSLAERMVRKFLDWHAANPRDLVAVEQALKVRIGQVEITGRVDRLESDDRGRAVVVDLKTGASAPREEELDRHPQLGVYQLAVLLGAFEQFSLSEPGGAELVQVGKAGLTARARVQRQDALADDPEPGWAKDLVETVAAGMAGPVFQARVNPGCRTCPVASCCPVNPEGEQVTP
jgi:superfamily I DNA/RNA helicase/RecB family exonuclease